MDRRGEHRSRGSFGRICLEPNTKFAENLLGIGENVHEVRDRRALIAADIADTIFEKRLGDGKYALTGEVWPAPSFKCSTSALKEMFSHVTSEIVFADVGVDLLKRRDKGAALVVGDALEHVQIGRSHVRP